MAFHTGIAHLAEQVHVFADLVQVFLAFAAEFEIHHYRVAVRGCHYAVGATGLQHSSVTVDDRCLVEQGVGAVKPG